MHSNYELSSGPNALMQFLWLMLDIVDILYPFGQRSEGVFEEKWRSTHLTHAPKDARQY